MNVFKDRNVGFYCGLAAASIALLGDIVFIIVDISDRTFSSVTFVFVLLGALCFVGAVFKNLAFLPVLASIFYGIGLGRHLALALATISDLVNEVNFVGGNAAVAIAFTVIFGLAAVLSVISCFLDWQKIKTQGEIKA